MHAYTAPPVCLPPAANGHCTIINAADICYVKSTPGHIITIAYKITTPQKHTICTAAKTKNLHKLCTQLSHLNFIIRVHKSWMINVHFTKKYLLKDSLLIMKDDTVIPVGRAFKDNLVNCLTMI